MQYTTILLAALSATGAVALPYYSGADTSITVSLGDKDGNNVKDIKFTGSETQLQQRVTMGVSQSLNVHLGKDVQNKDLRCQALDENAKPIVGVRGANIDNTFSDGDKGKWVFPKETTVSKVICDPALKKGVATDFSITVQLNGPSELATQTSGFTGIVREQKAPQDTSDAFNSVLIQVGKNVDNQAVRCQLLDKNNKPITGKRGANIDTTFSDAKKGEWTFQDPQALTAVSQIICDPAFKSAN